MKPSVTELIYRGMDAAALRQKIIANNVANANTPGFKRSFVTFEENVRDALAGKLPSSKRLQPKVQVDTSTSMREDGNNVDIDHEMVLMAANGIRYQALSQQLNDRFSMYRYIINEGRR